MDTLEKLDKVDLQVLRTLQENTWLTTKELAVRVSLSSTPIFERLKCLESGGYIEKYIAVLDIEELDQGSVVFCSVKLRRLNRDIMAKLTRITQDTPEVTECYNISGGYDYLLKIHAPNMKYYQGFILNVLGAIDSPGSLESTFVMAGVRHRYGIHIQWKDWCISRFCYSLFPTQVSGGLSVMSLYKLPSWSLYFAYWQRRTSISL